MKHLFVALLATPMVFFSHSAAAENQPPQEVTLTHRILEKSNCANDSCRFDFFHMTQKYGYGLSIEFGNDWGKNEIGTTQGVREFSRIIDLGAMSCVDMKNRYEQPGVYPGVGHGGYPYKEDRKLDPMFWLAYSDDWSTLQSAPVTSSIPATEGHCYLLYKSNTYKIVIVAFHVKELKKDSYLKLDEIEVFHKAELTSRN